MATALLHHPDAAQVQRHQALDSGFLRVYKTNGEHIDIKPIGTSTHGGLMVMQKDNRLFVASFAQSPTRHMDNNGNMLNVHTVGWNWYAELAFHINPSLQKNTSTLSKIHTRLVFARVIEDRGRYVHVVLCMLNPYVLPGYADGEVEWYFELELEFHPVDGEINV